MRKYYLEESEKLKEKEKHKKKECEYSIIPWLIENDVNNILKNKK